MSLDAMRILGGTRTGFAWFLLLMVPSVGTTQTAARPGSLPTTRSHLLRLVKNTPPVSKDIRQVLSIGPFQRFGCFLGGRMNLCGMVFHRDGTGFVSAENRYRIASGSGFKWFWWDWPNKKATAVGGTLCLISYDSDSDELTEGWWWCDRFWVGRSESDDFDGVYYYVLNFQRQRNWASKLPIGLLGEDAWESSVWESTVETTHVSPKVERQFDSVSYKRCLIARKASRGGGMVDTLPAALIVDKSECEIEATVWRGME